MKTIELRTIDHPEANGRTPQPGDRGYTLLFPLEDGSTLRLMVGSESFERFATMIGHMMVDDANDRDAHPPIDPAAHVGDGGPTPLDPASDEDFVE